MGVWGGERCPRWFGLRRRQLTWKGGWWVPHGVVKKWEAEDARTFGDQRAWAPQGSADFAIAYKAPPTEAQFAAHRQLQQARLQHQSHDAVPAPKPPPKPPPGTPGSHGSAAGSAAIGHNYLAKPPPPKAPPGTTGAAIGAGTSAGTGAESAAGHSSGEVGTPSPASAPLAIAGVDADSLQRHHTLELIRELGLDQRKLTAMERTVLEETVAAGEAAAQALAADDAMDGSNPGAGGKPAHQKK